MTKSLLLKNGIIVDPHESKLFKADLLIAQNGVLENIDSHIISQNSIILDIENHFISLSLFDLHTHTRFPGNGEEEDPNSLEQAALAGGYTFLNAMPNTKPVVDNPEVLQTIKEKFDPLKINIYQSSSITISQKGRNLVDFESMAKRKVSSFSEDGRWVQNSQLMREALINAKKVNLPILSHCEDHSLTQNNPINEGIKSREYKLKGATCSSESISVARDALLAGELNASIHFCHLSTKQSIDLIRYFKQKDFPITCETAPHYFSLTELDILENSGIYKVHPPLRKEKDKQAVIQGLKDGTIDVIATDHAPHLKKNKNKDFLNSSPGFIGLQTSFALAITHLYSKNYLTLADLIKKMTINPARIINIKIPRIKIGNKLDLIIFDPYKKWMVDEKSLLSKSKNSPFIGKTLTGKIKYVISGNNILYQQT